MEDKNKTAVLPGEAFNELYRTIQTLRAPGGCPWDREQTPFSLRSNLIEETYECIEAIEENDNVHTQEELGDIFLLAAMLSYMYEQEGSFSVAQTLEGITQKLIRRHPHVFSNVNVKDSAEVLKNWAQIKIEQEGRKPKNSILDEVSRALPALERAFNMQKKAAKIGFDWPNANGAWEKIAEETAELKTALEQAGSAGGAGPDDAVETEAGDLLFSVINLCRLLNTDPSIALQRANNKFEKRFKYVEKEAKEKSAADKNGKFPLSALDIFWNEAKASEKIP
ncbi:MAG: nucleoside triphosphate pyrophosphohydrolase [Spirochaetaceae bacterium]|jgi:tetrapyrrole methylase family protein/MazG family protein|nr:nucleoside triphosphate pyrophosphohydrolase [Spirochaetaceae bacterium]